ncbi:glycosyltransferase family 2 protein [Candidatus Gottesmanbacteria bacterium]|nr:glycosyltransferase family 2 protein [Candidatus Gottesmanbacteria bacterium]
MQKKLGIVILNWNNKKEILQCLESIKRSGHMESVVIVDNGSEDRSLKKIRNQNPEVRIIENKKNLGFAEGNNIGIRYLLGKGTQYILILNPDTEIEKDTIPNLLKVMEEDKSIGITGPKIFSSNNKIWSAGGVLEQNRYSGGLIGLGESNKSKYDEMKEVDFISGTAMMVKREVFEKCGLFNPDYFIYYEDVELNLRAKKSGYKLVFIPTSTITHHESSSMGKNSPAQEYYMARNHLFFVDRNAGFMIKLREMIRLPKTLYEHASKKEKFAMLGIKDYFLKRFGKYDYRS